jgi:alpha-ribazole phosphatase
LDGITVTRWWWVRHAPVQAPPGTIVGRMDLPCDLSDTGAVGALAARLPAGALWLATGLCRTRQTAAALKTARGDATPMEIAAGLVEQDFGAWQGMTHGDLADDPVAAAFWRDPALNRPPGGESFADLAARTAESVADLTRRHAGRDIVMVGHAGPIRAAVGIALGLTPERMLAIGCDCLHLTRLDHIAGPSAGEAAWRVTALNIPPR